MIEMMPKWFSVLTLLGASALLPADRVGLGQVQAVYLLPMSYGLDQYLANRLTAENVFQVVTDPRRADAVLTDQLGAGFERRLDDLFARPSQAAPEEMKPDKPKTADEAKKDEEAQTLERLKRVTPPPVSSFSRGKGNVFLVHIKTRQVLWSLYERPKKILPDELDRTSGRIVTRLKKDLSGKP